MAIKSTSNGASVQNSYLICHGYHQELISSSVYFLAKLLLDTRAKHSIKTQKVTPANDVDEYYFTNAT
jgi:hypothetical protein